MRLPGPDAAGGADMDGLSSSALQDLSLPDFTRSSARDASRLGGPSSMSAEPYGLNESMGSSLPSGLGADDDDDDDGMGVAQWAGR